MSSTIKYNRRKSDKFLNLIIIVCLVIGVLVGWISTTFYNEFKETYDSPKSPDLTITLVKTITDQLVENEIVPVDGSPAELAKRLVVKAANINGDSYLIICDKESGVEFIRGQKSGFLKLADDCDKKYNK